MRPVRVARNKEKMGAWKERALEALKKVSGPVDIKELAESAGIPRNKISNVVLSFGRTFRATFGGTRRDRRDPVRTVDLHPDLRAHVEYEKASH